MNYICIFALIFLGITGTISCIMALGEAFTYNDTKPPPSVIRCCDVSRLEYKVRVLLKATKGDVIILIPDKYDKHSEYYTIAEKLSRENGRVRLKQRKKYKSK